MDAPSTRGHFRVTIGRHLLARIPNDLAIELTYYGTQQFQPDDAAECWQFPSHLACLVSDIALSLAMCGITHCSEYIAEGV